MAFEGPPGGPPFGGVRAPVFPAALGAPSFPAARGPSSAVARSRVVGRKGPPSVGGPRRWHPGPTDAPATRAAAAARAAMLQQRRGVSAAAPVTRSSVEAPRGGPSPLGPPTDVGPPACGPGGAPSWPRTRQVLLDALTRLKKKDKKQFFAFPIDPQLVPDYHLVVRNPMNFETMRNKVEKDLYDDFASFDADVGLIISNCRLYNQAETPFCRAAALVEACWDKFRERFRSKYTAAHALDAAAAAAAGEGVEERQPQLPAHGGSADASAEKVEGAANELQADAGRGEDTPGEAAAADSSWSRQRLLLFLLMRAPTSAKAAATLNFLSPGRVEPDDGKAVQEALSNASINSGPLSDPFFWASFLLPDAAVEAEAAEKAAAAAAAATGAADAPAEGAGGPLPLLDTKGPLTVMEYPLPQHPGGPPSKRHPGKYLSYNASICSFVGVDALRRLESSCPSLRQTLRRLKQKEPPKTPLTDLRLFGVDTPDFVDFNSRLRFDPSLLLGVGDLHVFSARTLAMPSGGGGPWGPPTTDEGPLGTAGGPTAGAKRGASGALKAGICTDVLLALCEGSRLSSSSSSSNALAAAMFLQEQQQMKLRMLQAAAKAAAAGALRLGAPRGGLPGGEGVRLLPASGAPAAKRLKGDNGESEVAVAAATAANAAALAAATAAKPPHDAAAAADAAAAVVGREQRGDATVAGAPRGLPQHFDALYDLLINTPQQKQKQQQLLLQQQQQNLANVQLLQQQRLRPPGPTTSLAGAPLQGPFSGALPPLASGSLPSCPMGAPIGAPLPGTLQTPLSGLAQQQQQLLRQNRQLHALQQQLQQQQLQQQQLQQQHLQQQQQLRDPTKQQTRLQQQVQQNAAAAAGGPALQTHPGPQQQPQLLLQQQQPQLQQQFLQQQLLLQRQQQVQATAGAQPPAAQFLQQLQQQQMQPQQQFSLPPQQHQPDVWPQR